MVSSESIELATLSTPTMSYNHGPEAGATAHHASNNVSSPATNSSASIQDLAKTFSPPFKTSVIDDPLENMSAVYHDSNKHNLRRRTNDLRKFITDDINVSRIEAVQGWLWICGLRIATRPLHSQKGQYCRQIVVSDRADLHLCWDPNTSRMFIKPLPAYLLSRRIWAEQICGSEKLYRNCLGFLRTYVQLISEECDFYSARNEGLLPKTYKGDGEGADLTWPMWCRFVNEFVEALEEINRERKGDILNLTPKILMHTRWEFNELRLTRLSTAYRFAFIAVFRGYTFSYQSYGSFLSRNSNWLIAAFAYVAIVHGAMQVGLSTPQLAENTSFTNASYGFSIFSIIAPMGILFLIIVWMVLMFLDNVAHAVLKGITWRKKNKKKADIEHTPTTSTSFHHPNTPHT